MIPSTIRMESLSLHDDAPITRVLAPYAEQMIHGFRGQVANIPDDVKNDPALRDAFFQRFHDIAQGLQRDREINHSDLLHVRDAIEALRQQVAGEVAEGVRQAVHEAA